MSVSLIWRKPHVTLLWKLGRKITKKKNHHLTFYRTALIPNILYSSLFLVYLLLHINFANGVTLVRSKKEYRDDFKQGKTKNNNGESSPKSYYIENNSIENVRNIDIFNVTGLSKFREKFNKKDTFTSNHRKSVFKREFSTKEEDKISFRSEIDRKKIDNVDITKEPYDNQEYASSWAVKIPNDLKKYGINPDELILKIAEEIGLTNHGSIGHLAGHFLLVHHTFYDHTSNPDEKLIQLRKDITERLASHPYIDWVNHETVQKRFKRSLEFKDQYFPSQWHLVC